jgi:undecaprenyl-diphosphatase
MKWAALYQFPRAVLREIPTVWKTQGRALAIFFFAWEALWLFWHRFDYAATGWAHAHSDPRWLALAGRTSYWGELHRAPLIALALIALYGLWKHTPRLGWAALTGALSGATAGIVVNIIKCIFGRPRPSTHLADGIYWFQFGWDHQSFPSGHATHCAAIATAVGVLAPRPAVALWAGALFVMWSRWYSERHYVSDLWGGAGLGIAIGLIVGWAGRLAWQTWHAHKAAPADSKEGAVTC